jgi:chromate reductase
MRADGLVHIATRSQGSATATNGQGPTMSNERQIAVFVGSLRKDSLSRKVALALANMAPPPLTLTIVEIGDVPLYNPDLETDVPPASWVALRQQIKAADGVLFVTPEYNRSVPAALKNALDVGSRPFGASVWDGKPGAVITLSPGAMGGFGANHHLRQSLVCLNVPTMQQPEAYIGNASGIVDDSGAIADESRRQFLQAFINAYAAWLEITVRS